jgi:hypothetical protein
VCLVDILVLWLFSDLLKFAGFEFWACLQRIDGAAEYLYLYSGLISDYLWYPRHRSLWRWVVSLERVLLVVSFHMGLLVHESVHVDSRFIRFLKCEVFCYLDYSSSSSLDVRMLDLKRSFCLWTECSNMNVLMLKVNLSVFGCEWNDL